MNQKFPLIVRMVFMILDLLMLNTIFFLMKWYVLDGDIASIDREYQLFWMVGNIAWLICAWGYNLYEGKSTSKFENFLGRTFQVYVVFLILTLTYLYFSRELVVSRMFVSIFLASLAVSLLLNRMFYLLADIHFRNKEYLIKRVLIIGYNDIGKKLANYFERNNTHMRVVGYCEEYNKVKELSNYPILNTPVNAVKASQEFKITEIYSTILPEQDNRIYELMQMADQACIRFKLVPDFGLFVNRPMHLNYLAGMPVLTERTEPLEEDANRLHKRLFDIVFSLFAIVFILTWLIPIIGLLIWLESPGPIFFVQKRSGLNNEPFSCIKFRSMKVNKNSDTVQAKRDDDRFLKIGKILRKTNLDEFPQFFNVLKGDMSIVGPRPHMLKHTEDYSAIISKYMIRQFIKPGITGWAQVNGYRGETKKVQDMEARVDHDIWYVENWSILLDLKIIVLTAYNVFKGEKNAF